MQTATALPSRSPAGIDGPTILWSSSLDAGLTVLVPSWGGSSTAEQVLEQALALPVVKVPAPGRRDRAEAREVDPVEPSLPGAGQDHDLVGAVGGHVVEGLDQLAVGLAGEDEGTAVPVEGEAQDAIGVRSMRALAYVVAYSAKDGMLVTLVSTGVFSRSPGETVPTSDRCRLARVVSRRSSGRRTTRGRPEARRPRLTVAPPRATILTVPTLDCGAKRGVPCPSRRWPRPTACPVPSLH
jgi:hypothetical protein